MLNSRCFTSPFIFADFCQGSEKTLDWPLWSYLGPAVSSLGHAEANEDWVGHLDKDVVHTVHMDVLDPALLHAGQHLASPESAVQTSVTI